MKSVRDDLHDSLVATFQSLEGAMLNDALKEHGVTDPEVRRKIIGAFLFQQGVFLDQGWFKEGGKKRYPGVYFSSKRHEEMADATVMLPGPKFGTNFHEYAFGAADWAIENESSGVIESGNG